MKLVDGVWISRVPMYTSMFDDIQTMASFNQKVKDALDFNACLFNGCIEAGIPLSELLYRLLILRLEPALLAHAHDLQPVWHVVEWRCKHLADQDAMMRVLMKHFRHEYALIEAERAYASFRRKTSESGIELHNRLQEVYNMACLCPEFAQRFPEYTLPEVLVLSLDEMLHLRVARGLKQLHRAWRREKPREKRNRISPYQVLTTLTKIQQEIDTQLMLMSFE